MTTPRILLLDIETAPNTAHVWGLWNQNIGLNQLLNSGYVMSWAAKWLGSKEILFMSIHQVTHQKMLRAIHSLLEEADVVVHFNGKKFDIPTLYKEFVILGLTPPSGFIQLDLYRVVKNKFRFVSSKLDYVSKALGLGGKVTHRGHELWIRCMAKDDKAWRIMERYNKNDVKLLELLYKRLKGYIKPFNMSVYNNTECCPSCGSLLKRPNGIHYTYSSKYVRYKCKRCGHLFRSRKSINTNKTVSC